METPVPVHVQGIRSDSGTPFPYVSKRGNQGQFQAGEMQQWRWYLWSLGLWTQLKLHS